MEKFNTMKDRKDTVEGCLASLAEIKKSLKKKGKPLFFIVADSEVGPLYSSMRMNTGECFATIMMLAEIFCEQAGYTFDQFLAEAKSAKKEVDSYDRTDG